MKRQHTSKPEGRLVGDIDASNAARVRVYFKESAKGAEVLTISVSAKVEDEGRQYSSSKTVARFGFHLVEEPLKCRCAEVNCGVRLRFKTMRVGSRSVK